MTKHRGSMLAAVATTLVLAAGSAVMGQQSRPYGGGAYYTSGGEGVTYRAPQMAAPNNYYSDYPYAEVQAVPAAKARAAIARMELLRSQVNLDRGTRAAVRRFEKSDDMMKATADQDAAYARYQAARERALQPLENDAQYRAAQEMKQQIGDKIVEKHESAGASGATKDKPVLHEILAMAQIKMRYAAAATKREVDALSKSGEVRQARSLLVSSAQNTTKLRNRFNDDLREDPDLVAARRAVFDQKVAYVASHAYLDALYEARGIALDYAYFVRGYNPYRVMGYDPYGFRYSYYGYNY
jgi:hypothetical protein